VDRAWRAFLDDCSLWTELDLTPSGGLSVPASEAVLLGASARAGGQLRTLRIASCFGLHASELERNALLRVLHANAHTLRVLCCAGAGWLQADAVQRLCRAAPALHTLSAHVADGMAAVRPLLRNEGEYAPLRVLQLETDTDSTDPLLLSSFCADAATHSWLTGLEFLCVDLHSRAALDAVVQLALQRRLRRLSLSKCCLSAAAAPALARLAQADALAQLRITHCRWEPGWEADATEREAFGGALSAIIAADSPALLTLHARGCALGEAGLAPLLEALRRNRHLRELDVACNGGSSWFERYVMLPAVRANASLTTLMSSCADVLVAVQHDDGEYYAEEAEEAEEEEERTLDAAQLAAERAPV
jgi:hypothetical protein